MRALDQLTDGRAAAPRRPWRGLALGGVLLLALTGCGGDEEDGGGGGSAPAAARPAAAKPAAKPGAGAAKAVGGYRRVEDVVPQDERDTIRHVFTDRDFVPDITGNSNRDPFRSFVVSQPGLAEPLSNQVVAAPTEICSPRQQKAVNSGLRDLRLVGIMGTGLKRWALFQDAGNLGHVVTSGDCLGKEKARIKSIDAALVTLEIVPEPIPNQPPRPIEERSIPLYPDALPLGSVDDDVATPPPSTSVPVTTPPVVMPGEPVTP
ncbi:MAG: pilus assembly protein PilP [Kofleriaceae bacterium]